ncbi:hypothetical protein NHJ6243_008274 [Beauveria neobassiana]
MTVNKTPVLRSMEVNRQMPAARGKTSERFQKSSRAAVEKVLDAGLGGGAGLLRTPAALFFCVAGARSAVCQLELSILDSVVLPDPVVSVHLRHRRYDADRVDTAPMLGWSRMPLQQRAW